MCALLLNQMVSCDWMRIGYALCLASTKPTLRAETVSTREHHPRLETREHDARLHSTQQPPLEVTNPTSATSLSLDKEEALALTIGLSVTSLYTYPHTNPSHPTDHHHTLRKLPFELVLIGQPEVVSHCTYSHSTHDCTHDCTHTHSTQSFHTVLPHSPSTQSFHTVLPHSACTQKRYASEQSL